MTPWTDRAGRFSPLKAGVFGLLWVPALLIAFRYASGAYSAARPVTDMIHDTGDWAIRILWISLAITPLRRIADWPKLVLVRRMVGVACFAYATTHFVLYVLDQKFDLAKVAGEIASRFYLTVGFAALLALSALAATSTDAAVKRLGHNWNRLHKLVYAIAILAAFHFFMQTKADVFEATVMAGLLALLFLYRLAQWRRLPIASPAVLAASAVIGALATVGIEYAWYALATGVPPGRVLMANLAFSYSIRPAWWVLMAGLTAACVAAVRPLLGEKKAGRQTRRPARAGA